MLLWLWLVALGCTGGPPTVGAPLPVRPLDDAALRARVRPGLEAGEVLASAVLEGHIGDENNALLIITDKPGRGLAARVQPASGPARPLPLDLQPPPWRAGPALALDVDGDGRSELALMFEDEGERRPGAALAHPDRPSRPPLVGEPAQGTFRTVVLRADAAGAWHRDAALEAKVVGLAGPLPVQRALLGDPAR